LCVEGVRVVAHLAKVAFSGRAAYGRSILIAFLVLAFQLSASMLRCFAYGADDSGRIVLSFSIAEPQIERSLLGWDRVAIEGLPRYGDPGQPVLPVRPCLVLIPYGVEAECINVVPEGKVVLDGSYRIEPGATPVPLSRPELARAPKPDAATYSGSSPVPGYRHSATSVQSKRGFRLLALALHPVEYVPATGELSYWRSLRLEVKLRKAALTTGGDWSEQTRAFSPTPGLLDELRKEVDNPGALDTYPVGVARSALSAPGRLLTGGPYAYVIITAEAFKSAGTTYTLGDLRDARTSQGLDAVIVTIDGDCDGDGVPDGGIYANYSGLRPDGTNDRQTKIRNFIIDAYNTWGTEYVLFAGDCDGAVVGGETEGEIIPVRHLYAFTADWDYGDNIPADIYYSCLDGSYDYNANGVYGESTDGVGGGEVDLFAEVYVGRASVDSAAEISNFVAKTLAYETETDSEWLRRVEMVGEYLGFGGVSDFAGNSKDEIAQGSGSHGYLTNGFENSSYSHRFGVETLYDRDYPGNDWPSSAIIEDINGGLHALNHLGHGANDWVMKLTRSNVLNDLTNTRYFVGYSQACYSGSFDNWSAYGPFVNYDCVVEHLSLDPNGCAAFVANSRYGWGSYDSTDGPSQHFDREFWDAILGEDLFALGRANADSKEDQAWYVSSSPVGRWCAYELNLFGDPALSFRVIGSDGSIHMDRDSYGAPGEVGLALYDVDLDLNPGAPDATEVYLTSDTETTPEACTLTETGPNTRIFTGSVPLATGSPAADGVLQVAHGDIIVATYYDADNGTGSPGVSVDEATVDLVPAEITGVQVSQVTDSTALITWTTDESADSTVHYGQSPPPAGAAHGDAPVTNHSVLLTGLAPLTPYYFSVSSTDAAGNLTTDDNEGTYYYFVTRWRRTVFSDDMESGTGNWAHGGTNDEWEWGIPSYYLGPSSAHSTFRCWGTDLDDGYSDYADCYLLLPSVFVEDAPRLEFWHWYMIESCYDNAYVEINDGSGWRNVTPGGSYTGATFAWVNQSIDLSGYSGSISLRFRLVTDFSITYPGWYIDDVLITEVAQRNLEVRDAAGLPVFRITDTGDVLLKGVLAAGLGPVIRDTLDCQFLVKNSGESCVACVDAATGDLHLSGSVSTRRPSITPSSPGNLIVKDSAGNVVACIEADGDMIIRGEVHENHDFE